MTQADISAEMSDVGKLTEQEAYELAEILKQKLAEKQIPDSNQESLKQMVAGLAKRCIQKRVKNWCRPCGRVRPKDTPRILKQYSQDSF